MSDENREYAGKNYSIRIDEYQFLLIHPVGPNELYDSFDDLVGAHPICEEAREFFFGQEEE